MPRWNARQIDNSGSVASTGGPIVHAESEHCEAHVVTDLAGLSDLGPPDAPRRPEEASPAWGAAAVLLPLLVVCHFALVIAVIVAPNAIPASAQRAVQVYLVPFFNQDWKLFSPSPDVHDYQVFARGAYRTADGVRSTPWLDLIEAPVAAVQANRLSTASVRVEIVHKAALFTVRAAGPLSEVSIGRDAIADRWASIERQPASLIVLERLASAVLVEANPGLRFETVQVMVTARLVGQTDVAAAGGATALLFRPLPYADVAVR